MTAERLKAAAFVLRCAGAPVLALLIAIWLGVDHPVWATVSALVVSQDRLGDTRRTMGWRLVATVVGIGVAVAVGGVLARAGPGVMLGATVALCAGLTRWRGELRLSMWTAAIVLLTVAPGQTIADTGLARGVEVLIGGLVGAALHQLAEMVVGRRGMVRWCVGVSTCRGWRRADRAPFMLGSEYRRNRQPNRSAAP